MTMIPAVYVPIVAGLLALAIWLGSEKYPRLRVSIRLQYEATYLPFFVRTGAAMIPPWALGVALFGLAAASPRNLILWVVLTAIDIMSLAFALAFRDPQPFIPNWLRQEIQEGLVRSARPERSDWVLLWFWLALVAFVNVAAPVYLLAFHAGVR